MNSQDSIRKKILDQPAYWVEGINSLLYNAILDYMEKHDLNRKQLGQHLGISRGRVSQILNDGEINFSIEKLIEIALKVDKFPVFELKDKKKFYTAEKEHSVSFEHKLINKAFYQYKIEEQEDKVKVRPIHHSSKTDLKIAY